MFVTAGVLGLAVVEMWLLTPLFGPQRWAAALILAAMVGLCFWGNRRATGNWGLTASGLLRPSFLWAAVLTLPALLMLLLVGRLLGTVQSEPRLLPHLALLLVWALAQQFMLQTVVLREARETFGRRPAIVITALLFAAIHLPNPFLAPATFVAALGWCWVYDRYRSLLPIVLSHACASLTALVALGPQITGQMRVGYGYFVHHGTWISSLNLRF
jgi:membrane protease YdiL (CAAX protease family)